MSQAQIIDQLKAVVGADRVLTDADSLATFGKDWTKIFAPKPLAITFPNSSQQVAALVKLANNSILPSCHRAAVLASAPVRWPPTVKWWCPWIA